MGEFRVVGVSPNQFMVAHGVFLAKTDPEMGEDHEGFGGVVLSLEVVAPGADGSVRGALPHAIIGMDMCAAIVAGMIVAYEQHERADAFLARVEQHKMDWRAHYATIPGLGTMDHSECGEDCGHGESG